MRNTEGFYVCLVAAVLRHNGLLFAINQEQVASLQVAIIDDPGQRQVPRHDDANKMHTLLIQQTGLTDFVSRFAGLLQQQGASVADIANGRAKVVGWTKAASKPQAAGVTEQVGASA